MAEKKNDRATTWDERRSKRRLAVRLLLAGASGLGLYLLIIGPGTWTGGYLPSEAAEKIKDLLGPARALVPPPLIAAVPLWALIPFIGFWLGWTVLKGAATSIDERCLSEFNDQVLTRISPAKAFDPFWGTHSGAKSSLPWSRPLEGARQRIWAELLEFARYGAGVGRNGWKRNSRKATQFQWAVMVGMTGMGKSRFGLELAQHLAKINQKAKWHQRFAVWARYTLPGLTPLSQDPYDVGWLRPYPEEGALPGSPHIYAVWSNRREATGSWLADLARWRPRRPTLLLLDDPPVGSSRAIVETLSAAHREYLWPVRLIVINPTMPLELSIKGAGGPDVKSSLPHFSRRTFVFGSDLAWGSKEIAALQYQLPRSLRVLTGNATLNQFQATTRGLPLLVELGLEWLASGKPLSQMDVSSLVEDRADRLIEAFKAAGLSEPAHFYAVACATIARGGRRSAIEAEFGSLPLSLAERQHLFPSDTVDFADELPAIHPRIIGAAVARRILRDYGGAEEQVAALVRAAWLANPLGTLDSMLHLGDDDDLLGQALAAGVPQEVINLAGGLEIATLFAERAIHVPRADWEAESYPLHSRLSTPTVELIAQLDPAVVARSLEQFVELGEPTAALVRGDDYHRIVGAAFDRSVGALQEPPSAHDVERFYTLWLRWIAALDRWGTNPAIEYDLGFDGLHRWLSWIWGFKHDDDVFVLSFGLLNDVLDALSNADEPKSWFRPSCSNLIGSVYDVLTMPGLPSASVVWRGKSKAIRHRLVGDRASMVSELKSILTAACESENDSLIKVAMNTVQESLSRFSKSDRNPFDLPEIFQTYMDTGGHVSIGMALISYREDILRSTSDGNLSVAIGYLNSALDFIGKDVAPYSRKVLAECFSTILDQANNSALEEVRSIVVRRVRELEDCCPREDRAEFAANFGIRVSLAQAALRLGQRPLAWQELQKLDAALYKSPGWRGLTLSLLDVWRQFSAIDGQRALQRLRFWLRMFEGDYRFGASRLARDLMQETLFKSGSTSDSAWHLAEGIPTRPDFSLAMEHSQRGVMLELYCDAYRLCTLRSLELGEMARARLGLARLDGVIAEYSTASEPTLQYMKKVRSSLDHLPI